jgi:clan AA aspartic protease (TIGR02281 family)
MTQQIRLKLPPTASDNVVLLNVRLNDQTLVRMIVDTGAKYTIITPEVARRLAIEVDNSRMVAVTTATKSQAVTLTELQQVDIHGLVVQGIEAASMSLPSALGVEGLLGISFLRHCRMVLDIPHDLLEFTLESVE